MSGVTYAKVGGPPENWSELVVLDLDTGEKVDRVKEVDAAGRWLIRIKSNADGTLFRIGERAVEERIEGRFGIVHKAAA